MTRLLAPFLMAVVGGLFDLVMAGLDNGSSACLSPFDRMQAHSQPRETMNALYVATRPLSQDGGGFHWPQNPTRLPGIAPSLSYIAYPVAGGRDLLAPLVQALENGPQ
jgi:hypothetical protein